MQDTEVLRNSLQQLKQSRYLNTQATTNRSHMNVINTGYEDESLITPSSKQSLHNLRSPKRSQHFQANTNRGSNIFMQLGSKLKPIQSIDDDFASLMSSGTSLLPKQ